MEGKNIQVKCKCGFTLFEYFKAKKGRLQRCYIPRIKVDYVGVKQLENGSTPNCPKCNKNLGRITIVHGMPALKINHGTVEKIRT